MLLLDSDHLEGEELTVSELSLRSVECLYTRRKVDITDILTMSAHTTFLPDLRWNQIPPTPFIKGELRNVGLHIYHLLADP